MIAAKNHRLDEIERQSPHLKSLDEIAVYMRMDVRTVNKLIESGELRIRKICGQWRATKMQLDRYIEEVQ